MRPIIEIIRQHEEKRIAEKKTPHYITFSELQQEVIADLRKELNDKVRKGELTCGDTLNDKWIAIS